MSPSRLELDVHFQSRSFLLCLLFVLLFVHTAATWAESQSKRTTFSSAIDSLARKGISKPRAKRICDRRRTLNGLCTNAGIAKCGDITWGSAGTPFFSYIPNSSSLTPTRGDQPSARLISNVMSTQTDDMPSRCGLRELFVFFGEFLDHNLAATELNADEPFDIEIPPGDSPAGNFSSGYLHFLRGVRVQVPGTPVGVERVKNGVSSVIDLSAVYGTTVERLKELRTFSGGSLRMTKRRFMPLNTPRLENEPSHKRKFFIAGDVRANDHPVLTSLHTVFLREHNFWADRISKRFPWLSDETVFQRARKINIVQMQKIVYEEFIPAMTGRQLPRYRGHEPCTNPTISDIFASAAYRIGHTLVGNEVSRRGPGMTQLPPLPFTSMFFNPAKRFMELGMESFLRGAFATRAQEVDTFVSSSLRNFLFANVDEPEFSVLVDLIALNIQRGRDNALPGYNRVRRLFGIPKARKWRDITKNVNIQSRLSTLYKSPRDVDPWVGLMAEDHSKGSCMGPTVRAIWEREFTRLRDGDRHFYLSPRLFSKETKMAFPELKRMTDENDEETLKKLILRHTDIVESELTGPILKFG